MVFLFTILNVGIVLCSSFWSHAYPTTTDERTRPFSLPKFLHRNSSHLSNHSILRLNTSLPSLSQAMGFPQNHSFFQANHPLVGTTIPCTSDEKICLRHNMVYVPAQEACRPVGNSGGCTVVIERSMTGHIIGRCQDNYDFAYDSGMESEEEKEKGELYNDEGDGNQGDEGKGDSAEEDAKDAESTAKVSKDNQSGGEYIEDKNGELKDSKGGGETSTIDSVHKHNFNKDGKLSSDERPGIQSSNNDPHCSGYIMAYDGKCYSKDDINSNCGCDAVPIQHPLGGYECNCVEPTPTNVEQPQEDGLCRVPDFKFPDFSSPGFADSPVSLNCSTKQFFCFLSHQILMPEDGQCYPPLRKGPCPEDHVVALNESAALEGFAEGTCVHERGNCPVGYKRLAVHNECYSDRELVIRNIRVYLRPYGLFENAPIWITGTEKDSQLCKIKYFHVPSTARPSLANVAVPSNAVQNDRGDIRVGGVDNNVPNPSTIY